DFMIDLGTLNGTGTSVAADINNAGQVVGTTWDTEGSQTRHAFLWEALGGMADLGAPPGFTEVIATDINEIGQVAGHASYYDPVSGWQTSAFLWDAVNGITTLSAGPTDTGSTAYDLNDAGQVVGDLRNGTPAFLWTPDSPNGLTGSFTDLGTFAGARYSNA